MAVKTGGGLVKEKEEFGTRGKFDANGQAYIESDWFLCWKGTWLLTFSLLDVQSRSWNANNSIFASFVGINDINWCSLLVRQTRKQSHEPPLSY